MENNMQDYNSTPNNGQTNGSNGQFTTNNGQFNGNNGQFNQDNGQFGGNNAQFNQGYGQFGGNDFNQYRRPIRRREIALCIIFTLLTCGIYGIYWMIVINDDVNEIVGDREATSGGMVFLFSLLTCGIYGLYWLYSMGTKIDGVNGGSNSGILYVILGIFGLGIVSYAIMQDNINNHATM